MGYNILVLEANFRIAKENSDSILTTLKYLCKQQSTSETQNFAFVRCDNVVQTSNINDALSEWRWLPLIDDEGNIVTLEFTGEKLGDEQILFDAIAPFVDADSYIIVAGDDGKIWKWLFDGENCHYEIGKIVFN